MAQTTVSIRMDENLKKQLEWLCNELGMSVSAAVTVFAKTAVRERRIPFELRVATYSPPMALEDMSKAELDKKIQLGLDAVAEGRTRPLADAYHDMENKYKNRTPVRGSIR